MYAQLDARLVEEGYREIVCLWKGSEFESAKQYEGKSYKSHPQSNLSIRAIPSLIYIQLVARPVEKGCRKIVCSWKSSELKSAEQCEKISQKSRFQLNLVFAQFSIVCMFN